MKVPNFRPPNQGDFPGIDEQNIAALKVIGDQLELVTQALQSNISPEENGNAELKAVTLQSGVEVELETKGIKGKAVELVVLGHDKFDSTKLAWQVVDEDKVKVKVTWDNDDNQGVFIPTTLLVRGGN